MTDTFIPGQSDIPVLPGTERRSARSTFARNADRAAITRRRPNTRLPFQDVEMDIYLVPEDLAGQTITWPPHKFNARDERLALQHEASTGDFTDFVDDDRGLRVAFDFIGTYLDKLRSLLMSIEPGQNIADVALRLMLQEIAENAIDDIEKHGRAILLYDGVNLQCPDIRSAYPLMDGSWVFADPFVSGEGNTNQYDRVLMKEWIPSTPGEIDGTFNCVVRSVTGGAQAGTYRFTIGDVVEELEPFSARLVVVDNPPSRGWGRARCDKLIPIALEMNRRINWHSYGYDLTDVPTLHLEAGKGDKTEGFGIDSPIDPDEVDDAVDEAAETFPNHDVVCFAEGRLIPQWIKTDINSTNWKVYMDLLEKWWADNTGMRPSEQAATMGAVSGAAIDATERPMVQLARREHSVILNGLIEVTGMEIDWPLPTVEQTEQLTEPEPDEDEPDETEEPTDA